MTYAFSYPGGTIVYYATGTYAAFGITIDSTKSC